MQFRLFRLTFRRRVRKSQQQVEGLGLQAEAGLERLVFKRLASLKHVWRFVTGWSVLLLIAAIGLIVQMQGLSEHYQTVRPIPGGTYTEGILGNFTTANPLFATSEVDTAVSRLLFDGLFTYDADNQLVGNLASSYDVDARGTTYTVHLRANLRWHDGQPLTADDVVYTYSVIQNPDAHSPLSASWQGVTITKKDAYTVTFSLPNPLSSFAYSMTNGIVPQHLLTKYSLSELRTVDFNTSHPVGSGPFKWSGLQVERSARDNSEVLIALKPFAGYHRGSPKLGGFVIDAFSNKQTLEDDFRDGHLNAVVGLDTVPADLRNKSSVQQHDFILTAATMTFFNTASPILSDVKVRQALIQSIDTAQVIKRLNYTTLPVREPLLIDQLAYDAAYAQPQYDIAAAKTTLDAAGWLLNDKGVRTKAGQPLTFSLYAIDTTENSKVAKQLQSYWKQLGVQEELHLEKDADLQTTISARDGNGKPIYDALLYSVSIGVDPDVFVYWDSSQTDPRSSQLNLSDYRSTVADTALEAGRTRLDPPLRIVKYKSFLQSWQQDLPALGLYQPRFLYLTNQKVYGLDQTILNVGTNRYDTVQDWMIRTAKVTN